jgi:hypothetical protein
VCELLEPLSIGPVSDHAEHAVDAALAEDAHDLEDGARVLHRRHASHPADDECAWRDSVETAVVDGRRRIREPVVQGDAEPHDRELLLGGDPE